MNRATALAVVLASTACADDDAEEVADVAEEHDIDLAQAILQAEEQAGGVAIEAEVDDRRDFGPIYEVDVVVGDLVHEVILDIDTLAVLRQTTESADDDDLADAGLAATADWVNLVTEAERAANGVAFAMEVDADDGTIDFDVLVDRDTVREVVLRPDGTLVSAD